MGKDGLPEGWKRYVVRKKVPADCLWRIAKDKRHYGTAKLWRRIYEANRNKIRNPNLIYPKQVLLIPPKKGPTQLNKVQDSRKKKPATQDVEAIEADQKPASPAEESESGDMDNKKKAETMTPPATEEEESAENDEITPEEENGGEEENPENLQ